MPTRRQSTACRGFRVAQRFLQIATRSSSLKLIESGSRRRHTMRVSSNMVISGGEPKRMGKPMVPMPRLT